MGIPRARNVTYDLQTLRGDIFGGLTTMVVALPVGLGFGVASGLGAAAGLYGLIAVGFFAAIFGGTRALISGPTPPMAVAMAVVIANHADTIAEALTVVMLAGLMQVVLGLSRVGRFVAYTPYVVVSGFMSGIGIMFILIQTLPFVGAPNALGGPVAALRALPDAVSTINVSSFVIAAVTLAVAFLWPRRLTRFAPGSLVALFVGTLLGVLWLTDAPVIGEIPAGLPELQVEMPSGTFLLHALQPALILALLGSVNTLLVSLVADSLTGARHNPNRELVGQGIGNMAAGLVGGVPGAGAPLGTATNIRSGGRTRVSGVLCALFLLALVMGLGRYLEPIPLAALAGILMKVGWDIIDWRLLSRIHRIRREHLIVMLMTLLLTVFVDLVTAVAIGLIAAGMVHALQLQRLELDSVVSVPFLDRVFFGGREAAGAADPFAARVGMVQLKGSFTVASSRKLVDVIGADIKGHEVVIFDFSNATHVDDSAAMVIEQLIGVAGRARTPCIVMGLSGSAADTLNSLDILRDVPKNRIVGSLDEAREVAKALLDPPSAPPANA